MMIAALATGRFSSSAGSTAVLCPPPATGSFCEGRTGGAGRMAGLAQNAALAATRPCQGRWQSASVRDVAGPDRPRAELLGNLTAGVGEGLLHRRHRGTEHRFAILARPAVRADDGVERTLEA